MRLPMRLPRTAAGAAVAVSAALALAALGLTHAVPARAASVTYMCQVENTMCLRDPSSGGSGTNVLAESQDGSQAMSFTVGTATICGGAVSDVSDCPFSSVTDDDAYNDDPIYLIENDGSSDCIRAASDTSYDVVMASGCPDESSTYYVGGDFTDTSCPNGCGYFISVDATNADSGTLNYLRTPTTSGDDVVADYTALNDSDLYSCIQGAC
jgi:hypothetical protein